MKFIYLLLGTLLINGSPLGMQAQAQAQQSTPNPTQTPVEGETLTYDNYMSLGYNAQQEGRYYEAAQYFRNALYLNPEDRAAVIAYWNARDALRNNPGQSLTFDQIYESGV